ncbi:hypothetical protein FJQ54_02005 [Sandaracinobacter neustonicus]|uniref:Uncharacterized protein n=1 Tax=Sandaracinobacter neustonicus TaxID=1715348 RepID=A0A501XU89_9SPHN|nr:hypothetical protein [Sandaracinobacter neustonicus]TPE63657.1 hypothetical protein FJQ54_02005 [Sandaracinobacter neustonicus]
MRKLTDRLRAGLWSSEAQFLLAKSTSVAAGFLLTLLVYPIDLRLAQAVLLFDGLRSGIAPLDLAIQRSQSGLERARLSRTKSALYIAILSATLLFHRSQIGLIVLPLYALLHFLASQYAAHCFRHASPFRQALASSRKAFSLHTWPFHGLRMLGLMCLTSAIATFAYISLYGAFGQDPHNFYAMRAVDLILLFQAIAAQRLLAYGHFDKRSFSVIVAGVICLTFIGFLSSYIAIWGLIKLMSLYACMYAFVERKMNVIVVNQLALAACYAWVARQGRPVGDPFLLGAEILSLLSFAIVLKPWRKIQI